MLRHKVVRMRNIFLVLMSVIFIPCLAGAKSCRTYFIERFVSQHTVSPQYFFSGLKNEIAGGYSPLIVLKSPARIVLTSALKSELTVAKDSKSIGFQVLISDRDSVHITLRTFKSYGFKVSTRLTYFGTYWSSYQLTGERAEVLRFLRNGFARSKVIWAGKSGVRSFALNAKRWLSHDYMKRVESWGPTPEEEARIDREEQNNNIDW